MSSSTRTETLHIQPTAESAGLPIPLESQVLAADAVAFSYPYSAATILSGISISLAPGDLTAIIGPNGSGKTTLLRLLSGGLRPQAGQVRLAGVPLTSLARQEIAKRVAVVPQEIAIPFPLTVRQLVEMGRTPHLSGGWWRRDSAAGMDAISGAMAATATSAFASRPITELSGGERQRAIIAMALAQQPEFLLLDEPTTHLDIQHQVEVLKLLQSLNRQQHIAVLATMHDLNLAAMYFDKIVLLDHGSIISLGTPAEVFSEERLRRVFQTGLRVERHPTLGTPNIVLDPGSGLGHTPLPLQFP